MRHTLEASRGKPAPVTGHADLRNAEIAKGLDDLAELLEIDGANPFRVRAYRHAARTINGLPESIADMVASGTDLTTLSGIGDDLAGKIAQFVRTGHLKALEDEERRLPPGLVDLAALPGMGPKRIRALHDKLKINSIGDLAEAAEDGKLADLPHFGAKFEQEILRALGQRPGTAKRMPIAYAEEIGHSFLAYLKEDENVEQAIIAGSCRRRKDTVGDLDILATSAKPEEVIDRFAAYPEVARVAAKGSTRATVVLRSDLQVDIRVVSEESYGAALHYLTGSKPHNIAVRRMGVAQGLKINEYGVFRNAQRVAGRTEAEVYESVGLPYIEPELREDSGEFEAARQHRLPHVVALKDIRGDLHTHSKAVDGAMTIEEVAHAAKRRGYAYIAIADFTCYGADARGLDEKKLRQQMAGIDEVNARLGDIRILKSAEVDIQEDGRLDLPDGVLKELDFTIGAVHYKFDLSAEKQTERMIRAMDNPYFTILAHPAGRLINKRAACEANMERIIRAARERGCFLEINAHPERLDLDDVHARMAKDAGVLLSIATDARDAASLDHMRYGLDQARRGWLEAKDVLNTRPWDELSKLFKRR